MRLPVAAIAVPFPDIRDLHTRHNLCTIRVYDIRE